MRSMGFYLKTDDDMYRLIQSCDTTLQEKPYCLHTRVIRAQTCLHLNQFDRAFSDLTAILEIQPDNVHVRFQRGMVLYKLCRIVEAQRDLKLVLRMNPRHVMARYASASCYNALGEFQKANQAYTIALHIDASDTAARSLDTCESLEAFQHAGTLTRRKGNGSTLCERTDMTVAGEKILSSIPKANVRKVTVFL
ncbi:unnamed protein product [Albugo candida]|uniref:Uncharacterized protein n=1 Tax=Albugo candida TaxID=65357 RepID=A0A024G9D2_9STRA|nr:unnamed protein product [Albugo candida]|eukprot:CCI43471.1 unnamed protein product [Albugo candida]